MSIRMLGVSVMFLACLFAFVDGSASAQGKPSQADKGINKALQVVPPQAQAKVLAAAQKGQHKGQDLYKGAKGKGKGKR